MVNWYRVERLVKDRLAAQDPIMLTVFACWLRSGACQVSDATNEREVAAVKDARRQAADGDESIASFLKAVADGELDDEFLEIWNTFGFSRENLAENTIPKWVKFEQECSLSQLAFQFGSQKVPSSPSELHAALNLGSCAEHTDAATLAENERILAAAPPVRGELPGAGTTLYVATTGDDSGAGTEAAPPLIEAPMPAVAITSPPSPFSDPLP